MVAQYADLLSGEEAGWGTSFRSFFYFCQIEKRNCREQKKVDETATDTIRSDRRGGRFVRRERTGVVRSEPSTEQVA